MALPKITSLQKAGILILFVSAVFLIAGHNNEKLKLEDLQTMDGQIVRTVLVWSSLVNHQPSNGAKLLHIKCTLDNGRRFYVDPDWINNPLVDKRQQGFEKFAKDLRSAKHTRIWFEKEDAGLEFITIWQLSCDDVLYVDMKKNLDQQKSDSYFFYFTIVLGIGFLIYPILKKNFAGSEEENS